jgi:hypothetical protein
LFVVVIVLVTALLISALLTDEAAKTTGGLIDPLTAAGIKADDVDTFEIARKSPIEEKLVFQRKDKRWVLTAPVAARIDSLAVENVIQDLFAAKPVSYPNLSENTSTYNLTTPTVSVTLKKGDTAATVHLGTTLIGKEKAVTFVSTGVHPNRPLAVKTFDLRSLFRDADRDKGGEPHIIGKWLTDFRQKRLLSASTADPGGDLERIKLTRGDRTVELTRSADDWLFTIPANYGLADLAGDSAPVPNQYTGLRPMLNSILNLQTTSSADTIENVAVSDLAQYGLAAADPAVLRIELKPKGQPAEVLFIGKKVEKDGKPVVPTRVYCRVDGDSAVATVTTDQLESLVNAIADPKLMRNRDLVAETKRDRIDAIDSTFGGGFKLRRVSAPTGSQWGLYGAASDPTDAQLLTVTNLLNALARSRVATETLLEPNDAAFAAAQKKGELKVWFDSVDKTTSVKDNQLPAEPKLTGDPVTFTFGQTEGTEVFVRRTTGGKTTDFKVPTDVFTQLSKPRLTFVDPKLGSFTPSVADQLVLFRRGERVELKKEPGSDPAYRGGKWSFVAPDPVKGKSADGDRILDVLGVLAAVPSNQIHSEGASNDDLKKLGLDPARPVLSAKITLPGEKDKEREYHFGNETDDQKGVYFRLLGKPFVFIADRTIATQLETADLTDKVLLRVDPKRVKKLYLDGWKATAKDGKVVHVELALENGVWVAKDPAGVPVDTGQVDAILRALEAPKAISFVNIDEDKPAPPEFGFGDNSVSIIAALDDNSSVQLRIGGEDPAKTGYYGQANRRTFLMNPTTIRPVLVKPPLSGK